MKKGIAFIVSFFLLLSCLLLAPLHISEATGLRSAAAGPSASPSDQVFSEVYEALQAVNSMHLSMDMKVEMSMVLSYSGQNMRVPLSILVHVDLDDQKEPLRFRGQMSMEMNTMGNSEKLNALFYLAQEDGVITAYTSEDNGASWNVKQTDAPNIDPLEVAATIVNNSRDFRATGNELIDGTETVVYTGKLSSAFLQQAMEAAGSTDAMSSLMDGEITVNDLGNLGDIDVVMCVDEQTHLPLRYTLDVSELMKSLMKVALGSLTGAEGMDGYEMDVEIGVAKAECRLGDFNSLSPIEIPEDVKEKKADQVVTPPVGGGSAGSGDGTSILFIAGDDGSYRLTSTQIPETVLADDENVQIIAKALSYDPDSDYNYARLDLSIRNKTQQKLIVTSDLMVVNGFDIMGSMYEQIDPGATIDGSVSIDKDVLRQANIPLIADLLVSFSVSSEDYSLIDDTPAVTLRTDAPADFVQTLDESGVRLYEDQGITIIARYLEPWYGSSSKLILLVENRTDSSAYISTDAVKINGIDVDLYGNEFLSPHSNAITTLFIDEDALSAQGIDRIDTLSLLFGINIHNSALTQLSTDLVDIPVVY